MKRILLDVNILLDVLLDRPPYAESASLLWAAIENGRAAGLIPAHGVTTIHYLIGHYEYRDSTLPHYRLFIERDAAYRFTDKTDPGPVFMARVRQLLKELYGITLSD